MREFRTINQLAEHFNSTEEEIKKIIDENIYKSSINVGKTDIKKHQDKRGDLYIVVENELKEYLIKYVVPEFHFSVYVDDIEQWQDCEVLRIQNTGENIMRATVKTQRGTQLNRRVRLIDFEWKGEEPQKDGCIYMFKCVNDLEAKYS